MSQRSDAILPFNLLQPHIEQQKLCRLIANTLDLDLSWAGSIGNVCAIALAQLDIADSDLCTSRLWLCASTHDKMDKDISLALGNNVMHNALARTQDTGIHAQIRMQRDRLVLGIMTRMSLEILHDPDQLVLLHLIRKLPSHIARLESRRVRLCPYLQEMHVFVSLAVVL